MKRTAYALALLLCLSGCAGMKTGWRLQLEMQYLTPDDADPVPRVPPAARPA